MYKATVSKNNIVKISTIVILLCFGLLIRAEEKNIDVLIIQMYDSHDMKLQAETYEQILQATGNYNLKSIVSSEDQNWKLVAIVNRRFQAEFIIAYI